MIDDRAPHAGPLNMAIDEVLLQTTRVAVLHFYRWSQPSVSLGYFGRVNEAHQFAGDRSLVRRWTGGGIVPHGNDLTYSLMIARSELAYGLSSPDLYRRIHKILGDALSSCGIATFLMPESAPAISAACFANPVAADLLYGDQKIAGAAQRKTRHGLLHQGSIQREDLGEQFRDNFACALSGRWRRQRLEPPILLEAEKVAAEKYATQAWLRRR